MKKMKKMKKMKVVVPLLLGILMSPIELENVNADTSELLDSEQDRDTAVEEAQQSVLSVEERGANEEYKGFTGVRVESEVDPNDPNIILLKAMMEQKIAEYTAAVNDMDYAEEVAVPTVIPAEEGEKTESFHEALTEEEYIL